MARRYKSVPPAPVDAMLGAVAAGVWFVTQGVGWLRLLAAGVALGAVLAVGYSTLAPVRAPASTWGPVTAVPVVVAPARVPVAADAVAVTRV